MAQNLTGVIQFCGEVGLRLDKIPTPMFREQILAFLHHTLESCLDQMQTPHL